MTTETIAVAMSGGVDSSVAAALLLSRGCAVVGLHMLLHEGSPGALARAREAAQRLSIPLHVIDLRQEFRRLVIEPFRAAYLAGRTPNPCLVCNPCVKFGLLLEKARQLAGASHLATGHYVRLGRDEHGPALLRGADPSKDQSYFLALVPRERLGSLVFPLGELTKEEVRRMALERGLLKELPEESQEVCFLAGEDYRALLGEEAVVDEAAGGEIVDMEGNVLGRHEGVFRYTVGQRRGLGLPGPEALYVRAIDAAANRVVVATREEAPFSQMVVGGVNWLTTPWAERRCTVRIRYRQADQGCVARLAHGGRLAVEFEEPQRAVAPGQGAVFYEAERVLAGGIIEQAA